MAAVLAHYLGPCGRAEAIKSPAQVLCDIVGLATFNLMSFEHEHHFAIAKQCDRSGGGRVRLQLASGWVVSSALLRVQMPGARSEAPHAGQNVEYSTGFPPPC